MFVKIIIQAFLLGLVSLGSAAIIEGQFSALMSTAAAVMGVFVIIQVLIAVVYVIKIKK